MANRTRDVIMATRVTVAKKRAARLLARARGLSLSGWLAETVTLAIADQAEAAHLDRFRARVVATALQEITNGEENV